MKKVLHIGIVIFLATLVSMAGQGKKYGKALTVKEATPVSEILMNPEKFDGKRVLLSGEISEVCQSMGCWVKIADKTAPEPVLFKVEDGVIVFPKDGKGMKILGEGVVSIKMTSKEDLIKQAKHEAEEQGKAEAFDPSTIKEAKVVIRINGDGAEIGK